VRKLASQPVRTPEDLAQWQDAAAQLEAAVPPSVADQVPHRIWHYLADADVRFRDDEFRVAQERELAEAPQELPCDERSS
jgi:hypothetical protein